MINAGAHIGKYRMDDFPAPPNIDLKIYLVCRCFEAGFGAVMIAYIFFRFFSYSGGFYGLMFRKRKAMI
jgi:hypothetical protein